MVVLKNQTLTLKFLHYVLKNQNDLMHKTGPHCALAIPRQNLVFLLPLMLWLLQSRLTSFEEKVIWNCCLLLHYSIKTKGWPLLFLLLPLTFVLIASWKFLFSTMPADNDNVVTHGAPLNQPQLVSIFLPVFIHI